MNYRHRTIPSWSPIGCPYCERQRARQRRYRARHRHSPMVGPAAGRALRLMVYGALDRRDTFTTWAEARARYARKEQS